MLLYLPVLHVSWVFCKANAMLLRTAETFKLVPSIAMPGQSVAFTMYNFQRDYGT
jgi:hypothetical protein